MKTARNAGPVYPRGIRPVLVLTASLVMLAGCQRTRPTNMIPLDAVGMHSESIDQLHKYAVSDDEVRQIVVAGKAGMSEQGCVKLVGIARTRHRVFAEGDAIAELLGAGMSEGSVMQLVQMDQIPLFAGEAAAMRLAGLSDEVILDVARRRAKGQVVMDGARLAELRDVGYSNAQLVSAVDRGVTDKEADEMVARHNYVVGGHTFVHQEGRRR